MSMKNVLIYYRLFALLLLLICLSCSSDFKAKKGVRQNAMKAPHLRRIYVPEYFVYRKGKYEFVKGHHRTILFPKVYAKRSLRGYTTDQESASIR
jgi:hypothetical protein